MEPTPQRVSRRTMVRGLGTLLATGVLAACGRAAGTGQPGAEREPATPVTLEYWPHWGGAAREPAYAKLSEAFTAEHPKITINTAPYGHNLEKLISNVVAGTPPDVAIIRSSGQALAIKGAIQALDGRIAKARLFKKTDYADAQWEQYVWKGKIYAIPAMENGARGALVYNKRLFTEAGLNPNQPPKTLDELQRLHERITKEDGGQITRLGFDPWDAMSQEGFLEFWGEGMHGARWYDAGKLKLNLNSPEMVQAVEAFTSFRIRTGWDKVAAFRQTYGFWTGRTGGITQQTVAMQINGYWTPGEIRVFADPASDVGTNLEYTWVPTRRGTQKVQLIGGWAACMPAGVKQADAAWRFMEWLTTAKCNQILLDEFGFQNGNKTAARELKFDHVPKLKFYLDSLTQADKVVQPINIPIWSDLDRGYRAVLNDVGQGKKAAKAALDELQTQMQQLLDDVVKGT
jgi:multiple sugar transport system substrate-binding protein